MHCPTCRAEFRAGIERCNDCGGELLPGDLPPVGSPTNAPPGTVAVFTSGDAGLLALARSILESEGVPFTTSHERLQDLFGAGRLGLGYNPLVGAVELRVAEVEAARARELLSQVEQPEVEGEDDERDGDGDGSMADGVPPSPRHPDWRARRAFRLLVVADLAALLLRGLIVPPWLAAIDDETWAALDRALPTTEWMIRYSEATFDPFLLIAGLSAVGLLAFKRWGRTLFVLLLAESIVVGAFTLPVIEYGWLYSLQLLGRLTAGAIVALSFYGPVARAFNRRGRPATRPNREPASA